MARRPIHEPEPQEMGQELGKTIADLIDRGVIIHVDTNKTDQTNNF